MFKSAIAGTTAFFLLTGAAQAQLSETEQHIVAAVKQRTPAALELLEKSVRINSGTLNPEGVRAVGEIYRAELDALGFKTRWVEMGGKLGQKRMAAPVAFTSLARIVDAVNSWIAVGGNGTEIVRRVTQI